MTNPSAHRLMTFYDILGRDECRGGFCWRNLLGLPTRSLRECVS